MKIDSVDIQILKHLNDGRKSFQKISKELGVAENTVRARVKKMIDSGLLHISGFIDPENMPDCQIYIICVKLKTMNGIQKGEELSKLKGVIFSCVVTGRYDIIMLVSLNKGYGLAEFFTNELDPVEDVAYAETFVAYKCYNVKIPYTLE